MTYSTIKLPKPLLDELKAMADASFRSVPKQIAFLLNEYKNKKGTLQKYCEKEPLHTELIHALADIETGKNYKAYSSAKELFDDIP